MDEVQLSTQSFSDMLTQLTSAFVGSFDVKVSFVNSKTYKEANDEMLKFMNDLFDESSS